MALLDYGDVIVRLFGQEERSYAHLIRQLYEAQHELEALQARGHGESAPLARVDVQGLPEQ